jgi:hypothetical protein
MLSPVATANFDHFACFQFFIIFSDSGVDQNLWQHHMLAASFGEVAACLIRVPVEIIKQRRQTFSGVRSLFITIYKILVKNLRERELTEKFFIRFLNNPIAIKICFKKCRNFNLKLKMLR